MRCREAWSTRALRRASSPNLVSVAEVPFGHHPVQSRLIKYRWAPGLHRSSENSPLLAAVWASGRDPEKNIGYAGLRRGYATGS